MRLYLVLLCFNLLPLYLLGQNSEIIKKKDGDFYLDKAHDFDHEGDYVNAEKYYAKARDFYEKNENWDGYLKTLNFLSETYLHKDELEKYENLIKFAYNQSKIKKLKNKENKLRAFRNYARFFSKIKRDNKKAIEAYLDFFSEKELETDGNEKTDYNDLGYLLMIQGDYTSAIDYLEQSLVLARKDNSNNLAIYRTTANKAKCYLEKREYESAEKHYLEAYETLNSQGEHRSHQMYTRSNIGAHVELVDLYIRMENLEKAELYLNKLKPLKAEGLQLARVFQLESKLFLQQKKYQKSEKSILESINIVKPYNNSKGLSTLYLNLAEVYHEQGVYAKALDAIGEGIWILVEKPSSSFDKQGLPAVDKDLVSEKNMLKLLSLKSKILIKENSVDKLKEALAVYDYAFVVQKKYQKQILNENSKIFQNQELSSIFEEAIEVSWELYQKTKDDEVIGKCFSYMESSKSSILLEEIKRKEAEGFANIDLGKRSIVDSLKNEQKSINVKIAISKKENVSDLEGLRTKIETELRLLEKELNQEYPDYFIKAQEYNSVTVQDLKNNLLGKESALISFFLTNTFVYTIYIDGGKEVFKKIPLSNLNDEIKQLLVLRQYATKQEKKEYDELANSIYTDLIKPLSISRKINHLIIVPDKILYYLPFEMLQIKDDEFLLEKYNTTYTYSATILSTLGKEEKEHANNLLAIAPVFDNDSKKITLASSEAEIDNISITDDKIKLLREKASKNNFLEQSKSYDFIHLSTHAYAKGNEEPFIMFYNDTLFLEEIYAQRFNAEMIVLSACETGLGKEEKGEGLMSLSRGFTYAGIPSQVTSLWSINESATKEIIVSFYDYLSQGENKSEALRHAKIDYLETASASQKSPYYWAGLIQLGDFEAMGGHPFPLNYVLFGIGVFFIGLLFIVIRKKM